MSLMLEDMKDTLVAIDAGEIPNNIDYTISELLKYCQTIIDGQREELGVTKAGSWSVAPNDDSMPSDARVEFIFEPTYIAVSILCRVLLDHPWIAIQITGFVDSLKKGLKFCTYRELRGHGYEDIDGMLDALMILTMGKVPVLLEKSPDFCPELHLIFQSIEKYLSDALVSGKTLGAWGEDYTENYQGALESYYLMKDSELIKSIKQSKNSGDSDCVKELDW